MKIILAKTQYKTYNSKFLAIIKAFKIRRNYLKSCNHEISIFTDHNNLCFFMDIKSLSSK